MTGLLEVARREIEERLLYLAGGLLLGLLPLAAPLTPLAGSQPAGELRAVTAVTLFWIASLLFALPLGAGIFGRELAERRLGFYFSRPIAGWAILAGKLGGAVLVVLSAAALVLLPTAVLAGRLPAFFLLWAWGAGEVPLAEAVGIWLAGVVALVLAAHYLRTFALARSAWRLLDVAGVLTTLLLLRWITGRLLGVWAPEALANALRPVGIGLLVGLPLAVAIQVLRGRTELRRGHRLLASTLWPVMGAGLAVAAGYAAWVLAAGPGDLERFTAVRAAPAGDWLVVSGPARGRADYHPAFLHRVSDGTRLPLPARGPGPQKPAAALLFSADGSTACWPELGAPAGSGLRLVASPLMELTCAALDGPAPMARATGIELSRASERWLLALSADGRRLARLEDRWLTVEDLGGRRLLASERLPAEVGNGELFFDRSGRSLHLLALIWAEGSRLEAWRLEVASGRLERWLRLEGYWAWNRDPTGERLLLHEYVAGRLVRVELAEAGDPSLRRLEAPGAEPVRVGRFLADGRLILVTEESELWLARGDGVPLRRLTRRAGDLRLGGQPAPETLLVSYRGRDAAGRRRPSRTYLLDLASGAERLVGDRLVPLSSPGDAAASLGSRLLSRPGPPGWRPNAHGGRQLLLLDPRTLELRPVLSAG